MRTEPKLKFLFAGGGTGGHLFPALAVAEAVQLLYPNAECVFLGRGDKLEARMVPLSGFKFFPILAEGFNRLNKMRVPIILIKFTVGLIQSIVFCMRFRPHTALGTGGYISSAPIVAARLTSANTVLLESNSYPGISTKLLEYGADKIFTVYRETRSLLRNTDRIQLTGNPIRLNIKRYDRDAALHKFGFSSDLKTLVIIGGSGGAMALNEFVKTNVLNFAKNGIQVILQTGPAYFDEYIKLASSNIKVVSFFETIEDAYSAGDLFICRAGAATISELQYLGLPAILVPSPYVAENHQYYNAKALVDANAAKLVFQNEIGERLFIETVQLIQDEQKKCELAAAIKKMSVQDAAAVIAKQLIELALSSRKSKE